MLRHDEGENHRILEKYGELMTEDEKNTFHPSHGKEFQQEQKKEFKDFAPTASDGICGAFALVLIALAERGSLLFPLYPALSLAFLTLLMVASPWGCLLLSWNKREEWLFYVIGRPLLNSKKRDKASSRYPNLNRFSDALVLLGLLTLTVIIFFFFTPKLFKEYGGNGSFFFIVFGCLPGSRGWMREAPDVSDIDSRGFFKKTYSAFVTATPFVFSYWLFSSLPDLLTVHLSGIRLWALLVLTQGAWFLNWTLVVLLCVYSFLCELPEGNTEKRQAMRRVIMERYRARLKERKALKILPIGRFWGSLVLCLLIVLPFIPVKNGDSFLFFQSAGLIAIWLIFMFVMASLIKSHITDRLLCYAFQEQSEPAALAMDKTLLARQYKSLKIAAWFLFAVYLIGGSIIL